MTTRTSCANSLFGTELAQEHADASASWRDKTDAPRFLIFLPPNTKPLWLRRHLPELALTDNFNSRSKLTRLAAVAEELILSPRPNTLLYPAIKPMATTLVGPPSVLAEPSLWLGGGCRWARRRRATHAIPEHVAGEINAPPRGAFCYSDADADLPVFYPNPERRRPAPRTEIRLPRGGEERARAGDRGRNRTGAAARKRGRGGGEREAVTKDARESTPLRSTLNANRGTNRPRRPTDLSDAPSRLGPNRVLVAASIPSPPLVEPLPFPSLPSPPLPSPPVRVAPPQPCSSPPTS
jgi:hypothetical protein